MASFPSRKTTPSSSNKPNLTLCPQGIDASTSFAPTVPDEIKASISLFHILSSPAVKQAIDHVLSFLIEHNLSVDSYHKVGSIKLKGISETQFLTFLNEIRPHLQQEAIPTSTKSDNNTIPSSSSSILADDVERNAAVLFSALYSLILHVMVNRVKLSILTQGITTDSPHS